MTSQNNPLLTIITVCRNIASEIEETCRSVTEQTFDDFEWVVIDGASTDGTLEILNRYSNDISTLVSEPDRGVYHAMNKGIALARGKYLLFLNGGDYLASCTTLADFFREERHGDVLYGNELLLDTETGVFTPKSTPEVSAIDAAFFAYGMINHQISIIKRELFERYGDYDENFRVAADREKFVVFMKNNCTFEKVDLPVAVFKLGGISNQEKFAPLVKKEVRSIREKHFTAAELRAAHREQVSRLGYRRIYRWGGSGAFSILSVDEKVMGGKRRYNVLNIPLMKMVVRKRVRKFLLLGFIPVWKQSQ